MTDRGGRSARTRRRARDARAGARGAAAALALAVLATARPSHGHGFSPALLELRERADGTATVLWKVSPSRPPGADLAPILPPRCRPLSAPLDGATDDAITRTWVIDCGAQGLVGAPLAVRDLDVARTEALVRVELRDGRVLRAVLRAGEPPFVVPTQPSRAALFRAYLRLGIGHLLGGPDHLLFLFGLVLIVGSARSLLVTATAFTLGHSLTLALATLGIARLRQAPVEVLVAASVLLLAVEAARGPGPRGASLLRDHPSIAAAGFGLVHGLGFAGALREAGLPTDEIPLALLAFNTGIEIGQLAVIAVAACGFALLRRLAGRSGAGRSRLLARLPAEALGAVAAWWCIERTAALLGRG